MEGENQKLVLGASVIEKRIAILNANIFLKKTVLVFEKKKYIFP